MSLPTLHADRLTLFVFGPGVGELVALHVPPGVWMLVDGCRVGRSYAEDLLAHYEQVARAPQTIALVLWTHPHGDHAGGLPEILERVEKLPERDRPVIGFLPPTSWDPRDAEREPIDHAAVATGGEVQTALTRIKRIWRQTPRTRWAPLEGDVKTVGHATVRALSPTKTVHEAGRQDPNRLSTAVLVEWEGRRLVLGSDLVRAGWTDALRADATIATHDVLKIPHHGSNGAVHPKMVDPERGAATWLVTPFASSNLPRFDAKGPIAKMLKRVVEIHAASLPREHARQAGAPEVRKRSQLERSRDIHFDPVTSGFPDCFVAVELEGSGADVLHHGPGSVRILRG